MCSHSVRILIFSKLYSCFDIRFLKSFNRYRSKSLLLALLPYAHACEWLLVLSPQICHCTSALPSFEFLDQRLEKDHFQMKDRTKNVYKGKHTTKISNPIKIRRCHVLDGSISYHYLVIWLLGLSCSATNSVCIVMLPHWPIMNT